MLVKRTIRNVEQEYEYKGKEKNYDAFMQIRINSLEKAKLNCVAEKLGYKGYSALVKDLINECIDNYIFEMSSSISDETPKFTIVGIKE